MKKQQILLLLLLTMITPCLQAQKKELSQARSYIKSAKNKNYDKAEADYSKAEKLMTGLLKDSVNRSNDKIYMTWFESVVGLYESANEKLYLKQKYDTASFFNITKRLYEIGETLDSLDALPDEKGRVKMEYRKKNAEVLNQLRPNLYFGGTYHIRKGQYAEAYDYFRHYINAAELPLFTGYDYLKNDSLLPQAAYWATMCGNKLRDASRTLKYCELAKKDAKKRPFTIQYMCEAYQLLKDDNGYLHTLEEGFDSYPESPYFFPRLADYYTAAGRSDSVLKIAEEGLKVNPDHTLFLLAKSLALLNLERYDDCIAVSRRMIELNDKLPEPYFNVATCYLNQALELEQKNEQRKYRQQLTKLYEQARPYMETYRQLQPSDQKRWAPALYRVYLHLNMGKQFEEIDQLMRNH